jgi:hypothetical protein
MCHFPPEVTGHFQPWRVGGFEGGCLHVDLDITGAQGTATSSRFRSGPASGGGTTRDRSDDPTGAVNDPFEEWFAALEARHVANLTFQTVEVVGSAAGRVE